MQNEEQEVISNINKRNVVRGKTEICLRYSLLLQGEIIKIKGILFLYNTLNNAGKL